MHEVHNFVLVASGPGLCEKALEAGTCEVVAVESCRGWWQGAGAEGVNVLVRY